jgi:hypothetical protein
MKRSYLWQLYITGHTFLFGIPFLFFPNQVLPWLGFRTTDEPWIRIAGILFIVIGLTAFTVYRKQIKEMLLPSISVRVLVVFLLGVLAFRSNAIFLYILTGIVLIGVVGSATSFYTETKHDRIRS